MSNLSDFTEEERKLLISLPYRVGVWISHADDTEGEQDDELEMKALEQIIGSVSKLHEDMPFVHQIAQETLKARQYWPVWVNNMFDVTEDCQKAVTLLKARVEERALKNYRKTLMEIAHTVAEAWGEFGTVEEEKSGFGVLVDKITDKLSKKDEENHPMNISAAEDTALASLAAALRS